MDFGKIESLNDAKRHFENALEINEMLFGPQDYMVANVLYILV